jgi:hypothetical protein
MLLEKNELPHPLSGWKIKLINNIISYNFIYFNN